MSRLKRWLPGLQILSDYQAAWFTRDVMAGLVLATMLVPVGIAYALASGVPDPCIRITEPFHERSFSLLPWSLSRTVLR
jgi:MFS superfamily sulfate permease-like transporter